MPTSSIVSALIARTIHEHMYLELEQYAPSFSKFMHIGVLPSPFYETQQYEGYPLPTQRRPGEPVQFASASESFRKRFMPSYYAMGDVIPEEILEEDLHGVLHRILPGRAGLFAASFEALTDICVAEMFMYYGFAPNVSIPSGVNASPFGIDGLPFFHPAHPVSLNKPNVTFPTTFVQPMDLSLASYNLARQLLVQQPYPDGTIIKPNKPKYLVINPSLHMVAKQLVGQMWEPNSADRNINMVPDDAIMVIEWPYFRLSGLTGGSFNIPAWNAWMLFGEKHNLKFFWKNRMRVKTDSDIRTNSQIFTAQIAFTYGADDSRGMFGSPGV